jgi:hypothetical protein
MFLSLFSFTKENDSCSYFSLLHRNVISLKEREFIPDGKAVILA